MLRGRRSGRAAGCPHCGPHGRRRGENRRAGVFAELDRFLAAAVADRRRSRLRPRGNADGFKWISRVPGLSTATRKHWDTVWPRNWSGTRTAFPPQCSSRNCAAAAKADGKTIFDTLDELYLVHGLHASDQLSIRVADLGLLDAMMNRLRVSPPEAFGGSAVEVFTDLAEGSESLAAHGRAARTSPGTKAGSSSGPAAPNRSSSATWKSSRRVDSAAELPAARQAARTSLDDVLRDVREALGL